MEVDGLTSKKGTDANVLGYLGLAHAQMQITSLKLNLLNINCKGMNDLFELHNYAL